MDTSLALPIPASPSFIALAPQVVEAKSPTVAIPSFVLAQQQQQPFSSLVEVKQEQNTSRKSGKRSRSSSEANTPNASQQPQQPETRTRHQRKHAKQEDFVYEPMAQDQEEDEQMDSALSSPMLESNPKPSKRAKLEPEERQKRRKEINRLAAQASRDRKKNAVSTLSVQAQQLRAEQKQLDDGVAKLEREGLALKKEYVQLQNAVNSSLKLTKLVTKEEVARLDKLDPNSISYQQSHAMASLYVMFMIASFKDQLSQQRASSAQNQLSPSSIGAPLIVCA